MIFIGFSVVDILFVGKMEGLLEASVTGDGTSLGTWLGVAEGPVTTTTRGSLGADHRYGDELEKL